MWGGRFKEEINQDFFHFQKSIEIDWKLAEYDIYHSIIHTAALKEAGVLNRSEAKRLTDGLNSIFKEVQRGEFKPDYSCEDIHTDIQNRIEEKVGSLAQKLHTLRSRNDQVVFDQKWYCYKEGIYILGLINMVLSALNYLGSKYRNVFLPGYTHTQRAQIVSFLDYTGAFFCMFERDFERLDEFVKKSSIYIGSGALAGSAIPKAAYSEAIKKFLKKIKPDIKTGTSKTVKNSLDNVASRDFVIEFLNILSILQMHLSRLAEDFILYSTKEFDFLDLPEEFCTGSSLMPHKKNPDFLELVRGNSGKIYGNLISVLTTMKGLPLTYNRDMQLDKEPLFSSTETIKDELKVLFTFLGKVKVKKDKIRKALEDQELYATELVEFLVKKGIAFKDAHDIIGKLIRHSEDSKIEIKEMKDADLAKFHNKLTAKEIKKVMTPEHAIASKKSLPKKKHTSFKKSKK